MVRRKQRRRKSSDDDIDPMAGTTNLVDAMLVLELGFLIFVVISWNAKRYFFRHEPRSKAGSYGIYETGFRSYTRSRIK